MRYWQDLESGQNFKTGVIHLSDQDILKFAAEFDPQPYHLDSAAAKESIFGGLCASGWQVCALLNRLLLDTFKQQEIAFIGIHSIPQLRWKVPVFAGSSLSATLEITDCNTLPGDVKTGTVDCDIALFNQDKVLAMSQQCVLLIAQRPPGETAQ